jgi:hypothetical protein
MSIHRHLQHQLKGQPEKKHFQMTLTGPLLIWITGKSSRLRLQPSLKPTTFVTTSI